MSYYLEEYLKLLEVWIETSGSSSAKKYIEEKMQHLWYYYLSPADKEQVEKIKEQIERDVAQSG